MEFSTYQNELKAEGDAALKNLERNLSKIALGGANPQIISTLKLDYYGTITPIGDLVSITHPEPQQLVVKPFDHGIVRDVYNLITKQQYSLTVQDEGDKIRLIFPTLTTEKRKETIKQLATIKEQAKIKVRNSRHAVLKKIKNDESLSEDMQKQFHNDIQEIVDQYIHQIDQIIKDKEEQLMKI